MPLDAVGTWLQVNGEKLISQLNGGKYRFMPASGFNIAKSDGQYRRLVRLTAIDSVIQTVIIDQLSDYCSECFSADSFAYQRGKGVGKALQRYCQYAGAHPYAVKLDPKSCFDHIAFDVLEKNLQKFFFDRKTVNLLMDCAKMSVISEGRFDDRNRGILQGAPVSGLLCNVYFHFLDLFLEEHAPAHIRYGDDIVVFADSYDEAAAAAETVENYLNENLRLAVNRQKTCIGPAAGIVFLGNRFFRGNDGAVIVSGSEKSASAYYEWFSSTPKNHRNSIDILSDGIFRQKDYSALFPGFPKHITMESVTSRFPVLPLVV